MSLHYTGKVRPEQAPSSTPESSGLVDSPFNQVYRQLHSHSWPVIPIQPGEKRPGDYSFSGYWYPMRGWSEINTISHPHWLKLFSMFPDAGVGSPVPVGVVWLDLDTVDDNIASDIIDLLEQEDGIHIRRRGKKGFAQPLLIGDGVELPNAIYLDGAQVLDFLQHGRQVVLPPTIHPDTGAVYQWLTADSCENISPDDLPVLTVELLSDILDALSFHGAVTTFKHKPSRERVQREGGDDGDPLARKINDKALQDLDSWVPALDIHPARKRNGNYSGLAVWRPSEKPLAERLKNPSLGISSNGIKDFGADEGLSPIDLVMSAQGVDFDTALIWLQERVAPLPACFQGGRYG